MAKKISSGYHIDQNGQVSRKGDVTLKTPINVEKYSDLSSLDSSDGDVAIVAEKTTIDGNVYPNNTSFIKNNGEWIPLSGYASAEDVAKFNEIDNKVDKEDGKGLSTNDFTNEDKVKLDNLVTPMQIKGRKDTVDELPIDANIGDVWLVGEQGSEDFEEYLCVEVSGSEQSAIWENVGHTKNTPDWNENDPNSRNYINNRIFDDAKKYGDDFAINKWTPKVERLAKICTDSEKLAFLTDFVEEIVIVNRDKDIKKGKAEVLEIKFYGTENPSKN